MALTGDELLKLTKENAGASGKQLAEQAGYTTTTKAGKCASKCLPSKTLCSKPTRLLLKMLQLKAKVSVGVVKHRF
jgi:hypothetical protein